MRKKKDRMFIINVYEEKKKTKGRSNSYFLFWLCISEKRKRRMEELRTMLDMSVRRKIQAEKKQDM